MTTAAPAQASPTASALVRRFAEQSACMIPAAMDLARLVRERGLEEQCEDELQILDVACKLKPKTALESLIQANLLALGLSDLFEEKTLDEAEQADLERSLEDEHPALLAFLRGFPALRPDKPWLSTCTEGLQLDNLKRYAELVTPPEHWQLDLDTLDCESCEPYGLVDALQLFSSLADRRFSGFHQQLLPTIAECRRRIEARIGPLLFEPVAIVDSHPMVLEAFAGTLYGSDDALASASSGLIIFSVEGAEESLRRQELGQLDSTTMHELIHVTQPSEEDEDYVVADDRVGEGRQAIIEGATEALARRLLDADRVPEGPRDVYNFEWEILEALASRRHGDDAGREEMLKRISGTQKRDLLDCLRRELGRPLLSEAFFETVGFQFEYRYSGDHQENPYYDSWLDDQAVVDLIEALEAGDYDERPERAAQRMPAAQASRPRRSALAG